MSIETFLRRELALKPYANEKKEEENRIARFFHNDPLLLKVINAAILAFSCYCFKNGFSRLARWDKSGVSLILLGSLTLAAAAITYKVAGILAPPNHSPHSHSFKPQRSDLAELKYRQNLPVLTIKATASEQKGFAHGYFLAAQIYVLRQKTAFAMWLKGLPNPSAIPKTLEAISKFLTSDELEVIDGMVKGYNTRASSWTFFKGTPLTKEEVLFFQILPDIGHLEFKEMDNWLKRESPIWNGFKFEVGCTTIVDGNTKSGPILARNLDWQSLGIYGTYTILIESMSADGTKKSELTFPGFLGTLTGMNQHGLCLAMNVCRGETDFIDGIPVGIFNRRVLEKCKTVVDVKKFIQENKPLGPYHLIVADKVGDAVAIHFYQNNRQHFLREWNRTVPLITTNFRYSPAGRTRPTPTNSEAREQTLKKFFEDLAKAGKREDSIPITWLHKALELPHVNNIRTIHHVLMDPKSQEMLVSFDNGWAAASLPLYSAAPKFWFGKTT